MSAISASMLQRTKNECLSITKFHICLLHWNETPEQSHIIHYKKFSPKQARHLQLYSPKHSTDSLITSNLISFRFSNNRLADRRPLWLLTASIPVYYTKTLTRHSRLKDPSGAAKTVYAHPRINIANKKTCIKSINPPAAWTPSNDHYRSKNDSSPPLPNWKHPKDIFWK